jgi:hypothetical protein
VCGVGTVGGELEPGAAVSRDPVVTMRLRMAPGVRTSVEGKRPMGRANLGVAW